ncbi:MAG: cytochrome c, partial [Proteobacteria bacterium]|nr:cytochrome c [Pseudomonadota bacterium]
PTTTPTTPTVVGAPAIHGVALYGQACSGCHGSLASSNKRGASAAAISNGIANLSIMKSLSTLTTDQIAAIATALK